MSKKEVAFTQGMLCAAAIIEGMNCDAEEVIKSCGIIDWSTIEQCDIEQLSKRCDLSKYGYEK